MSKSSVRARAAAFAAAESDPAVAEIGQAKATAGSPTTAAGPARSTFEATPAVARARAAATADGDATCTFCAQAATAMTTAAGA